MFKNGEDMAETEKLTKSERTRESILQQALFLFQKDGYESVTMRDLAKACDSSLGSFYYHFKNKEEIVLELFKASLSGHVDRTQKYLESHQPSLETVMTWICRDRFKEFESYRAVLRVLVQRLDPHDPVSPWHKSSQPIREQSVALFDSVVSRCLPNLDLKTKRQLARALWLQHLLILGVWSFDRSPDGKETEAILKQSIRLWKNVPSLIRVPGMKAFFNLVLSPLERFEKEHK
jgi:AcrR family transcriptional regulator